MMLDDEISNLIADIYAGAHDLRRWDTAMEKLSRRLDARWMMVGLFDNERRAPTGVSYYGASDSRFADGVAEYVDDAYRRDPVNHFAARHPEGGRFDSRTIAGPANYLADDYVRWNQDRFGSAFWNFVHVQGDGLNLGLSLHRALDEGPLSDAQAGLLALLFSHIDNAVRLAARPPALNGPDALLLLDAGGRLLSANETAKTLVARRDGVMIVDGYPRACDRRCGPALDRAVGAALRAFVDGGMGGSVALHRPHGPPLLATVRPLPPAAGPLPALLPAAVIRLVDTTMPDPAEYRADWAALFGFTAAESRLARMLLLSEGNLRDMADSLGVAYATARAQLSSLFAKAGVGSQMQLVRLLMRLG